MKPGKVRSIQMVMLLCFAIVVVYLFQGCFFYTKSKAAFGEVIQSFRSPGNWPEGLAWDGRYLWNSDGYGRKIYVVDPDDGSVVRSYTPPGTFPESLEFAQDFLYHCDWDTGLIYKLRVTETELIVVQSFPTPGERAIGISFDGRILWHTAWNQHVYAMRPEDGSIIRQFSSPNPHPEDLAWDGTNLWITDWYVPQIQKIDVTTGAVLASFPSPGNRPVGLTFDGRYLWHSDTSGWIYKIDIGMETLPSIKPVGLVFLCLMLGFLTQHFSRSRKSNQKKVTQDV